MMKRFGIILGAFLLFILLTVVMNTSLVERKTHFNEVYYKLTIARLDSIKSNVVSETGSIQAGFAKESITPILNSNEDNYQEGKFINVPLSGFGARKGKYATGIHDSIFVKAATLKVGSQTVVFVGADLLIMPPMVKKFVRYFLFQDYC